jgi:hypothetical protein
MTNDSLNRCPVCKGDADNGHSRDLPPDVYLCTKCVAKEGLSVFPGVDDDGWPLEIQGEITSLLPCPFCCGANIEIYEACEYDWFARCVSCGVDRCGTSKEGAAKSWNTRTTKPVIVSLQKCSLPIANIIDDPTTPRYSTRDIAEACAKTWGLVYVD